MASKTLFTTVDKRGNLVPTTGTFTIGRFESKGSPLVIIFTSSYSKGSADTPSIYKEKDIIYVNPKGFLGVSTTELGAKLQLVNSATAVTETKNNKLQALQSKFPVG